MTALPQAQMDEITRELRAADWWAHEDYPCGCELKSLCDDHSSQRATDHYHPEQIR